MATVQLANVYNPTLFAGLAQEQSIIQNNFINSGVLVPNGLLDERAMGAGTVVDLPFFGALAEDEPNVTSDDPATNATPANVDSLTQIARLRNSHKSWAAMNLAQQLSLQDPVGAIASSIGKYWATDAEQVVINSLRGVMNDNITNDSSDMVNVSAAEATADITATTVITDNNVIDTIQTAGDASNFSTVVMHSVQYRVLQKAKLVDYTNSDSDNSADRKSINLGRYLNMTVVVDDTACAPRAGTGVGTPNVYPVYLISAGAFGLGNGNPMNPSEMERDASSGNGGGQDIIHSRVSRIIHPSGFAYTGTAGTYADLADGTKWDRVVNRKNVGIAVLEVN